MGREIRRVPTRWKHPHYIADRGYKGSEIAYRPVYQQDYDEAYKEWEKDLSNWFDGYELWHKHGLYWNDYDDTYQLIEDVMQQEQDYWDENNYTWYGDHKALMRTGEYGYEEYAGKPPSPPSPNDYMPRGNWYQLFETVSEGTPLSPPFKTKQQLVEWLTNNEDFWGHRWTKEQAAAMVKDEYAPSLVVSNGKVYTAEESTLL